MKPTFLKYDKPIITLMVLESTPEEAISVINEGHKNGADVVKIVSVAENEEELNVSFDNIKLLKEQLESTPFLYLVNGKMHKPIRENGCDKGVCMYLCVNEYKTGYSTEQPLISRIKEIRKD